MDKKLLPLVISSLILAPLFSAAPALGDDGEDEGFLIIEDDTQIVIEGTDGQESFDTLIMTDETGDTLILDDHQDQPVEAQDQSPALVSENSADGIQLGMKEFWLEYGAFTNSASSADTQGYLRAEAMLTWSSLPRWEAQLALRTYGYLENGSNDVDELKLDYGEAFIRYNAENTRLTVGAQEVIWGRIDEFPPSDRLSTQDITRFVLDDLEDRRRASPAIRYEHFSGNSKLDILAVPYFRAAELPDRDSVWFPVNQQNGEILGLESTVNTRQLVQNARIKLDEPDSEGGLGFRYSTTLSGFDYALTVQKGRQNLPYFTYNPALGELTTVYPRSWFAGGDIGFEALGGTLRFEAAWVSDTPVTRTDGRFTTVESINWGAAFELFPGDGDGRLNLQLTGYSLLNAPSVLDRDEVVAFNGSYELPFKNDTWRIKMRFYAGLDEKDTYLNPELAYTGWSSQEVYVDVHYFDGANGTPGAFHEDHSSINIGWRLTL